MKQKIKKLICVLLACQLFVITAYARPAWPSDTGIQAEAGIVMDVDSGAVLFGQNIHVAYPPASITKLLTALVVLEHCALDETVTFSETAVNSVEPDSGNKLGSVAGDQLTVEDCLYGMLLVSSNQAANALAEHTAGSISAFVDLMNEKLTELGCEESHFDNPSGLNGDTQYVSAYDMALISQAAFNNPDLLSISSTLSHKLAGTTNYPGGLTVTQEHRLLKPDDDYYYAPAKAGKTGYLIAAGNTLVTYAEQDGRRLVSVILKGSPRQYFLDSTELLSFGFRSFQNVDVSETEERYVTGDETLELPGGAFKASELMIEPGSQITLPLEAALADAELTVGELPENHPERAVALMTYTYTERVVGTAFLLTKEEPAAPAEAPEETVPAGNEAPDAETEPAMPASSDAAAHGSISAGTIALIVLAAVVLALLGGGAYWIMQSRKKEAEALKRRREQRRERLKAAGEEEEFERLLAEAKKKRK